MYSWRTFGIALAAIFCLGGAATAQVSYSVSGRVTNEQGLGIAGVVVTAHRNGMWWDNTLEAATTGDGFFQFLLPAGDYAFTATPPRFSDYVMKVHPNGPSCIDDNWPTVTVNNDLSSVDFELVIGGRLAFALHLNDDSPANLTITAVLSNLDAGGCFRWDTVTLDQGSYTSPAIDAGNFLVSIEAPDYPRQYYCGTTMPERATRILVTVGESADLAACNLILSEPTHVVSGTVTDESGAPIPGVTVGAYSDLSCTGAGIYETQTDSNGSYELALPEGEYKVRASDHDGWYGVMYFPEAPTLDEARWVDVPSSNIDFRLPVGGKIAVHLRDATGKSPGEELLGTAFLGGERVLCEAIPADGLFQPPPLPAGAYSFGVEPIAGDSKFTAHFFCGRLVKHMAEEVQVTPFSLTELGECELIESRFLPHRSSGYLFSFDPTSLIGVDVGISAALACGDLDHDGTVDVVMSASNEESGTPSPGLQTYGNMIYVFQGRGDGSFENRTSAWVPFLYKGGPRDIELCDVDGDDFLDLILGNAPEPQDRPWGERDAIWRNIDGEYFEDYTDSWMPPDDPSQYGLEESLLGTFTHSVALGDVNNDGFLDIVRGCEYEQILLNDGSGRMVVGPVIIGPDETPYVSSFPYGWGITLFDANEDGNLDAFFAGSSWEQRDGSGRYHNIIVGDGTGQFRVANEDDSPSLITGVEIAYQPTAYDFDSNGQIEVYVANVSVVGDLNFHASEVSPLDQLVEFRPGDSPTWVDITDRIEQDSTFNTSWTVTKGDIDNDGFMDILVSNNTWSIDTYKYPEIRLLMNDGSGRFSLLDPLHLPPFAAAGGQFLALDADLDGDLDLFMGSYPQNVLLKNELLEKHDLNGDRLVTDSDWHMVLDKFGERDDLLRQDLNRDGVVDSRDLSLILRFQTRVIASNNPSCICGD